MRIRIDSSAFQGQKSYSGVGHYSKLLTSYLRKKHAVILTTGPLHGSGNFSPLFNRIYRKISSYDLAPPFDLFMKRVDLTIFPNFALWPTVKSKLKAVVIHDLTFLKHPDLVEKRNLAHLKRVVPRSIKRSDFVITVSETIKAELVKTYHLSEESIVVTSIPPSDAFLNQGTIVDISKKYSLPQRHYILFLGNEEPRKNLTLLIEAYSQLPNSLKQRYCLVLAGGSGWNHSLVGLNDIDTSHIKRLGYVPDEDIAQLYQQASLFVMPSLYEGFGMPILEAAAAKTPVISSDIPVLKETGGEGVLYINPRDANELATQIQNVLTDDKLAKKLIDRGTQNLKRFSWDKNIEAIQQKAASLL